MAAGELICLDGRRKPAEVINRGRKGYGDWGGNRIAIEERTGTRGVEDDALEKKREVGGGRGRKEFHLGGN